MNIEQLPGEIITPNLSRLLPVQLSIEEIATRGRGIGDKAAELQKLRDQLGDAARAAKEKIRAKEQELDKLMETMRSGTEDRIVACHERFHAGTVVTVREDVMEVVGSPRPANPAERQKALPGLGGGGLLESADKAEKKQSAEKKQVGFEEDEDDKKVVPFNPPRKRKPKKDK